MIDATNATFYERPVAFNGIGACVAINVLPDAMIYFFVLVAKIINPVIDRVFVSIDHCFFGHVLLNERHNRRAFGIGHNLADNLALALCDADNGGLAFCSTSTSTMPNAADIGLVNFDLLRKHFRMLIKKCADLFEHTPSCFIGYARSALKLFGRVTASGSCYPEHSLEPNPERSSGLFEDCASHRGNIMSAKITGIGRAIVPFIMLGNLLAHRTLNPIRVLLFLKPFKASIVIREQLIEMLCCILGLFRLHFLILLNVVYPYKYWMSRDNYLIFYL